MKLFFDTETTGLPMNNLNAKLELQPSIVEIAVITLDDELNEVDVFNTMVNPKKPIDPGASKASGIFDKDVVGAPSFAEIYPELKVLWDKADEFWAHNHPGFDRRIMEFEVSRINKTMEFHYPLSKCKCTLDLAQKIFPHAPSHKLELLHRELCDPATEQTHRALDDVRLMIDIWKEFPTKWIKS